MKIYTKTGDKGLTSLSGGKRVKKSDLRIEAYGTIDELNAHLGIAAGFVSSTELKDVLTRIQNDLFTVGADLATPINTDNKFSVPRTSEKMIEELEKQIDKYGGIIPQLRKFILPGGTKGASILHLARTVCRRAERRVVELSDDEDIGNNTIVYLNRLSDLLFVLARFENFDSNRPDIEWEQE